MRHVLSKFDRFYIDDESLIHFDNLFCRRLRFHKKHDIALTFAFSSSSYSK